MPDYTREIHDVVVIVEFSAVTVLKVNNLILLCKVSSASGLIISL